MYWLIILSIPLMIVIINHFYKTVNYWKHRGVTYIKAWPLLGSMPSGLLRKYSLPEQFQRMYNMYPNAKYVGLHQFRNPILLVRDPEIIKQITVKDFDSFINHRVVLSEDIEPLFGRNLLSLKGQRWKDMRSTLSPAFTGSKMRLMFHLITECAEQFVDYFTKEARKENGMVTAEMKDIFTRYTTDVIGTAAFGIKCDSLEDKENEFYMAGKKSTTFTITAFLKIIAFGIFPWLMKKLRISFMDRGIVNFFSKLILTTLRTREQEGIIRPDMIHLLMEAKKGQLKHEISAEDSGFSAVEESSIGNAQKTDNPELTDEDIIAQAFLFFFAGYDTGSTLMGFMAYELALNIEIQTKLQKEVDAVFASGKVDYESILKMKYLDMVVSESLRKWPPAVVSERVSEKSYTFPISNENEKPIVLEKDISVWMPIYGIHHDPKYFSDPERFDPERFSDENKDSIAPFTYMPFGNGPRNCIGSRFALLEMKILFVHFLSKFDFTVVEKTQIPLKFSKKHFNLTTENGIWLGLKLRN